MRCHVDCFTPGTVHPHPSHIIFHPVMITLMICSQYDFINPGFLLLLFSLYTLRPLLKGTPPSCLCTGKLPVSTSRGLCLYSAAYDSISEETFSKCGLVTVLSHECWCTFLCHSLAPLSAKSHNPEQRLSVNDQERVNISDGTWHGLQRVPHNGNRWCWWCVAPPPPKVFSVAPGPIRTAAVLHIRPDVRLNQREAMRTMAWKTGHSPSSVFFSWLD